MACAEASWRRTDLVAVHVWTEPLRYSRTVHTGWDEAAAGWQERYRNATVRRVVDRNTPVPSLLDNAAAAQLLVVGSRGHRGFAGMLLGSASQALIHYATCPMLVVRPVRSRS